MGGGDRQLREAKLRTTVGYAKSATPAFGGRVGLSHIRRPLSEITKIYLLTKKRMPEEFREKSPEREKAVSLNNFRFYLPGGAYRSYPAKESICKAVDNLLQAEFGGLDVQQVSARLTELQAQSLNLAMSYGNAIGKPKEAELEQQLNDTNSAFNEEYDKLRPLFERLIEMGFDPKELAS